VDRRDQASALANAKTGTISQADDQRHNRFDPDWTRLSDHRRIARAKATTSEETAGLDRPTRRSGRDQRACDLSPTDSSAAA
jgi:hypothetical protein